MGIPTYSLFGITEAQSNEIDKDLIELLNRTPYVTERADCLNLKSTGVIGYRIFMFSKLLTAESLIVAGKLKPD